MRPTRPIAKFAAGAFGLALGAAMLSMPARAGDDDVPIDSKILRGIMHGLGLKDGTEASINYQERAPLVIPSSKDLPPPQNDSAVIANNPAWPKDPDIARAKLLKKMEKEASGNSSERVVAGARPLSPQQLTPYAQPGKSYRGIRGAANASEGANGTAQLAPDELGYKGGLFSKMFGHGDDSDNARFTGEPARTSLTEPPAGYQVPSPDQPYGLGKGAPPKATDYYTSRGGDFDH